MSAAETLTARSAVEGASPAPPRTSTGPSSVETKASGSPGYSVTGAAKKRGTKPEVTPRISTKAEALADARPATVTTIGSSGSTSPGGGGGAMTVSSVAVAESTRAVWPANVTALASGSGRKPRPLRTTRSPTAPRGGLTSVTSGRRPM